MFENSRNFVKKLDDILKNCVLCPRECRVDRTNKEVGFCKTKDEILIASNNLHFGEEPPISGQHGSGTIFFSNCNLACVFCQNYPISQLGNGKIYTIDELVQIMLRLQSSGAHNINFVSPTHYSTTVARAVFFAKQKGLKIPIVYNCGGYESETIIELLKDTVDIYLVDMKYGLDEVAQKYSKVSDYVSKNFVAIKKMFEIVGNLELDKNGIAKKGVIVRHLVLPENLENTKKALENLAKIFDPNKVFLSFMSQYHPAHKSYEFEELSRKLTQKEYDESLKYLDEFGFKNGWIQHF